MTPAATRYFGPEFGRQHLLHLPVCAVTRDEERYKMLGRVAPIHVESKRTAVRAADVATQALQLSFILV